MQAVRRLAPVPCGHWMGVHEVGFVTPLCPGPLGGPVVGVLRGTKRGGPADAGPRPWDSHREGCGFVESQKKVYKPI